MSDLARPERIEPGPGQESVWDYPRPPRLEPSSKRVEVHFGGETIADSRRALRVCETSTPPAYYVPYEDIQSACLVRSEGNSFCEWKGTATYYDIHAGGRIAREAAWTYLEPNEPYADLKGYVAFYPARVDACFLDGERVRSQPGDYYGGWVTDAIAGPFKGGPGTMHW